MSMTRKWDQLAAKLLDREWRPSAVVDKQARVLKANRAFHSVTGELPGLSWLSDASRTVLEEVLWRGGPKRLRLTVATGTELMVEFQPFDASTGLLVVNEVMPSSVGAPTPVGGVVYEVSVRDGMPGHLVRRVPGPAPKSAGPCWSNFGRLTECSDCPVRKLRSNSTRATSVIRVEGRVPGLSVVNAELRSPGLAALSAWAFDASTFSLLVGARLAQLRHKEGLTEKEARLFELFVHGSEIDAAASAMGIAPRTIKYHQQNLLRKLRVESRHALFGVLLAAS